MANVAQRSFAKGEIAPELSARTDQVAYATGLRTCRNFRVLRQGGIENRPGTVLVGETPRGGVVRLLPFVFNDTQTYVLEFSNTLLRLIRNGAYIQSGSAPYTLVTPYTASDLPALQITQSGDVVTIVHPSHVPMSLTRSGDTSWALAALTFAPAMSAPIGLGLHPGPSTGGDTGLRWVVTAVDATTGQESLASAPIGSNQLAVIGSAQTISWTAVAGAKYYNIYKGIIAVSGQASDYGFVGTTASTSFYDAGAVPDMLNRAPVARNPFPGAGDYPGAVAYYQDRRVFAATNNHPDTIWTSRSADYNNFTVSVPSQDDDALTLTLVSRMVGPIKHLVDHVALYAFAQCGEWVVSGDQSGVLRPTDVSALNFSKHGASALPPISIDARILFVQARQAIVRDIAKDPFYGYKGNDLTLFATHLFDGFTLVDWAYQETPHSIVWVVRSDGVLLGLTDVAEQQIQAWHRHDTLGTFENVCVVPEGTEDAVYVCVNRNGVRYIERFASRYVGDIQDAMFLDSALSFDGRNTNTSSTVTLSGGSTWASDELLTLTANTSLFSVGNIGDRWRITGTDATGAPFTLDLRITAYTSETIVQGFVDRTVPTPMRSVAFSTWARAVTAVSGLGHLEGRAVSAFGDGYVAASPNNPAMPEVVVSGGIATFDRAYAYLHVGLPFVSDMETLDVDTSQGPSRKEVKMLISRLILIVNAARGIFAGTTAPDDDSTGDLVEWALRDQEPYDTPTALTSGAIEENIPGSWNTTGHVFVRQVDPVPLTILGAIPVGVLPGA